MDYKLKNMAKRAVKSFVKAASKKMLAVLLPFLLPIAGVFIALLIFVAAIYGAMPGENNLTGVKASEQDQKIQRQNDLAAKKWNVADYYKVPAESPEKTSYYKLLKDGKAGQNEIIKMENLFNMKAETVTFLDNNGKDAELANKWGDIYSTLLYDILQKGKQEFPTELIDKVAKDLHPYFFVKPSTITNCYPVKNKNGSTSIKCVTYNIYLLAEAKTIRGWYQYKYEWHTEKYSNGGSRTYERLKDVKTLEKWDWIEDYLVKMYGLENTEKTFARMSVLNASEGFTAKKEWMEWLIKEYSGYLWVSTMMVPPELRQYFQVASEKYNIPWWFLAAVALKESSFDPRAVNDKTGCFGLMQVSPDNWINYAPRLGYDVVRDKENPRAQIMVGTYLLYEQGLKNINWGDSNWKEETLDVLMFYGGYRGPLARERCKAEYAEKIWAFADRLQAERKGYPVPGNISSYFGSRKLNGVWETHNGIDIASPAGAPIISVSGGIVEEGYDDLNGNYVRVKDLLYQYSYAHMSEKYVVNGQKVIPGQIIGLVGDTGLSYGPHLHFGIKVLETQTWVDPLPFLEGQN